MARVIDQLNGAARDIDNNKLHDEKNTTTNKRSNIRYD